MVLFGVLAWIGLMLSAAVALSVVGICALALLARWAQRSRGTGELPAAAEHFADADPLIDVLVPRGPRPTWFEALRAFLG